MSKEHENYIRETVMVAGFPIEEFMFNVDEFDIDFMREFKDRMYWEKLLTRRLLSNDFIREMNKYFSGYIRMIVRTVYLNNNYSDKFKNELKGLDPSLK